MPAPRPIAGWDTPRETWLALRRAGIGASDISTLLGLSPYGDTPWQLWADKTGVWQPRKQVTEDMELGTELEPWLIGQAPRMLGLDVTRTPHMMYAHSEHEWRLCSPDAFASDGSLVETKTGKLASYGNAQGWDNGGIPLAYELQCRWQMHVMDRNRVYVVALIAGMGRIHRTVDRSLSVEHELARQVSEWRQKHVTEGAEPPVGADDNMALGQRYAITDSEVTDLDGTPALEHAIAYKQARETEAVARKEKQEQGAALKNLLGTHTHGTLGGHLIATWNPVKGDVDWQKMATDLAAKAGIDLPDPDEYRKPETRTLSVK